MKQYDVVFLGSGHAAWHAALTLKQSGKQVAIVEKDTIAGTCTCLLYTSDAADE